MTTAGPVAPRVAGAQDGDYPDLRLLIDGEWRMSSTTSPVVDPATEEVVAQVPHASTADVDDAVASARRGFATWRLMPPAERAVIIRDAARLVRERADRIARVITREIGKPQAEAKVEVRTAVGILEWNADEGRRAYGRIIPGSAHRRQVVLVEPIGPVAAFAPWNAPLITPSRKISSALAAGCSVVIKPAEETPGTAICLAEAFADAGLPAGVLNVVFGDPAAISERLLTSDVIRAVTFTGSTAVGRSLAALAAANMKRAVMELGGHAPVVVCADADPVRVAAGAARARVPQCRSDLHVADALLRRPPDLRRLPERADRACRSAASRQWFRREHRHRSGCGSSAGSPRWSTWLPMLSGMARGSPPAGSADKGSATSSNRQSWPM